MLLKNDHTLPAHHFDPWDREGKSLLKESLGRHECLDLVLEREGDQRRGAKLFPISVKSTILTSTSWWGGGICGGRFCRMQGEGGGIRRLAVSVRVECS